MTDVQRWCPTCGDNLFTQSPPGFMGPHAASKNFYRHWVYRCTNCGQTSKWDLQFPIPVHVGPPTYQDYLEIEKSRELRQ